MTTKSSQITIPPKSYFTKAANILQQIIDENKNQYDFNRIRRAIFNSKELNELLTTQNINSTFEISAGTSDRNAYPAYLTQIAKDLKKNKFYKDYAPATGSLETRKATILYENLKFGKPKPYNPQDICFTSGSTGAIATVFEYIKATYPKAQVLIPAPNYYFFKLSAQTNRLLFKEVFPNSPMKGCSSFINARCLIKSITKNTKLIVIVNPANPSGEIYADKDLNSLVQIAKKKNITILADEIFSQLTFANNRFTPLDQIAARKNALSNLVTIKSFSKGKNLAALRCGYLLSKNADLIRFAERVNEKNQCFPSVSNYTGLAVLDSFIQSLDIFVQKNVNSSLSSKIKLLKPQFSFSQTIREKSISELANCYLGYKKYQNNLIRFYSSLFDQAQETLKNEFIASIPKQSAFNTIVKIKNLENTNIFDFTINLFLTTGIKAEIGPCFGLSQKQWQNNPNLGFWLRLTFARPKTKYIQALKTFINFKYTYLASPNKFLKTNLLL